MFTRNANFSDINDIKRLLDQLNHSSVELLPSFFKIAKATDEQVEKLIKDENCHLIIAEDNDKIIGLIEAYFHITKDISILVKKEYIYIQNLIVDEHFRRKGVGKSLIDAVKKLGEEKNIKYYRLSVIPNNISAIKFYEREGFEGIMYSMEMKANEV